MHAIFCANTVCTPTPKVKKKSARAEQAKVKRAKEDADKGLLAKALGFVQSPVIKYVT